MSCWGTIDATFKPGDNRSVSVEGLNSEFEERGFHVPTGSEEGPKARILVGNGIWVEGRLRDVSDLEDSPVVLAWFVRHALYCDEATLTWEIDGGPRYQWVCKDGILTRLRGVLE